MTQQTNNTATRIVVGITGASGAVYAQKLIRLLLDAGIETHLVVSPNGQRILHEELGIEAYTGQTLLGLASDSDQHSKLILHAYRNVAAHIASGSFPHDGMIVIPCSSNTLAAVAAGRSENLLHRAAQVCLKQRRKLLLVHREMPLNLIDIRNMQAATEAGAIITPACPGFYMLPQTVDDLVDFVTGRCLDLLNVPHTLDIRWHAKTIHQRT